MTEEIIEKINSIAARLSLEEAHVQHLFTLARKLIERVSVGDRPNYAVLKFYCDWTLHSEIDRSEVGALVLSRIHKIILDNLRKTDNSGMAHDLTNALSLNEARTQLNTLIFQSGGSSNVFSITKWNEIIPILAEIISRCTLKIGSHSKLLKILQLIKSQPLKGASVVEELSIVKIPGVILNPNASREEVTYYFLINTSDTTKFVVPLVKAN